MGGQAYKIFGMAVKPQYLAIATLLGTFGGAAYFTSGGNAKEGVEIKPDAQEDDSNNNIDVEKLLNEFIKDSGDEKK